MKTIIVKVGEEYQVKIADYPDQNDFFFPAYQQAAKELCEIIQDTITYHEDNQSQKKEDYSNNIIAFDGDRGQGKSSAMLSFSNFLKTKERIDVFFDDKKDNIISTSQFLVLQRIDPTKVENSENILTIILAKLFHCFIEFWGGETEQNPMEKGEILQLFENCYNEIEAIKSSSGKTDSYPLSNLERLKRIGDSESLKKDFLKLILKILNHHFKDKIQDASKQFLVIQLDDTDLNTARAHEIVEDVRKYFMLPNVIILMAADIEQLTYSIEQEYIKQFEKIDSVYKNNQQIPIKYHRMAVKYIDKLIPGKRNIHLPVLKAASRETPEINSLQYIDTANNNKNVLEAYDNKKNLLIDIQEVILHFIYKKTGLIFIKPTNYLHYIIPRTMRGLVNFLSILNSMADVEPDALENKSYSKEQLIQKLHNIEQFETFFVSNWIPTHVDIEYREIIQNFIETPWTIKSKQLIRDLRGSYYTLMKGGNNRKIEDDSFLYKKGLVNDRDMVALADVRDVLAELENYLPNQELFKFTFAIRTLYSINASKIICNNLIKEYDNDPVNKEYLDNTDNKQAILQFYGGKIFGQSILGFIPTESSLYERSFFEIEYNDDRLKSIIDKPLAAEIIAFFCSFSFPNSQRYIDFLTPFQADNGTYSKNISFNVTNPIFYLFQTSIAFKKVNIDTKTASEFSLDSDRFASINILSSLELMNKIEKDFLENNSTIRSTGWKQSNHVIAFYKRIQNALRSITYLPLSYRFEGLLNLIDKDKDVLNTLHDDFRKAELNQKAKSGPNVPSPKTIRETKNFELLKHHIINLRQILMTNQRYYRISFQNELQQLATLSEAIQQKTGNMTQNDRDEFQRVYNKAARSAQKKLDKVKNENQQTES